MIMKKKSIITLLTISIASIAYAQDSTSVQSNKSTTTYNSTTTTETHNSTNATGREFKPFKVGVGLGYAVPGKGDGAGGGVLLYVEPAYRASDFVSIGLRLESALIVRGVKGVNG